MADAMREAVEREQMKVLVAEVPGLLALDVHDADQPVFGNERHRQFRADFRID